MVINRKGMMNRILMEEPLGEAQQKNNSPVQVILRNLATSRREKKTSAGASNEKGSKEALTHHPPPGMALVLWFIEQVNLTEQYPLPVLPSEVAPVVQQKLMSIQNH